MQRATHPLFLGIDVAFDSASAVLLDVDSKAVLARAVTPLPNVVKGDHDAVRDRCFEALRSVVRATCRAIRSDSRPVSGLGVHCEDPESRAVIAESLRPGAGEADACTIPSEAADWLGIDAGAVVAPEESSTVLHSIGIGATKESITALRFSPHASLVAAAFPTLVDPDGCLEFHTDTRGDTYVDWSCRTGEWLLEELRVGFSTSEDLDPKLIEAAASALPIGANGVLVQPLAEHDDPEDARDAAAVLGIAPGRFRASLLHRAALEGIAFAIATGADRMRALGVGIETVRFSGPGSGSELRRRILSSILETQVVSVEEPCLVARGAALCAAASWFARSGDEIPLADFAFEMSPPATEPMAPDPDAVRAYRKLAEAFHAAQRRATGLARIRRRVSGSDPRDARGRRQGRLFDP